MIKLFRKLGRKEKEKQQVCSVIVAASGSSSRMEGLDKILVDLDGMPLLAYSLKTLNQCPLVSEIILVTREDLIVDLGKMCREFHIDKASKVMVGGKERRDSVLIGVLEAREDADLIAIHDGARPFLSTQVLEEVLREGRRTGAAAPAIPVTDTIKQGKNGLVEKTLPRETLFAVQTPQVFHTELIKTALQQAVEQNISLTDDCSAVERLGMKVTLTAGEHQNLKITTPLDLAVAERIVQGESQ